MPLVFLFFLFLGAFSGFGAFDFLNFRILSEAQRFQGLCLENLIHHPSHFSPWMDFDAALLCGRSLPLSEVKDLLIRSSLYHVVVVSGGHLSLWVVLWEGVSRGWRRWNSENWRYLDFFCLDLPLCFYTLVTGFQPPLVRALLGRWFFSLAKKYRWHWEGYPISILSVLGALVICPQWLTSFSLLLSATASLGLFLADLLRIAVRHCFFSQRLSVGWIRQSWQEDPSKDLRRDSYFHGRLYRGLRYIFEVMISPLTVYICVAPLLLGWSSIHPIGVFLNIVFVPFFSVFILPLSLFYQIFPQSLGVLHQGTLDFFFQVLRWICSDITSNLSEYTSVLSPEMGWVYWMILGLFYQGLFLYLRRRYWTF